MRFKHLNGQLARWLEEFSQYNMEIIHRPGKSHLNADALSRLPDSLQSCDCYHAGEKVTDLPCGGCPYCKRAHEQWERFLLEVDNVVPLAIRNIQVAPDTTLIQLTPTYSSEEIRELQEKDPDLKPILNWLTDTAPSKEELFIHSAATKFLWLFRDHLEVRDSVLYYRWETPTIHLKLVVPASLKDSVVGLCHDPKSAGHYGQQKTYERVKRSFHWYALRRDVVLYVATCAVCNKNKKASRS